MKLGTKVFFFITTFFCVIFLFTGYTLISFFYETAMERERESAIEQYQYNKFVMQSTLITRGKDWFVGFAEGKYDATNVVLDMKDTVAFFSLDGSALYSQLPDDTVVRELLTGLNKQKITYRFTKIGDRLNILVAGIVSQKDTGVYLVTGVDVENVLEQQKQMVKIFGRVYVLAIGIAATLIYVLSTLLTRSIKRLTDATKQIADGNYEERIRVTSEDEVGQLAKHFNQMAEAIEEKVQELSLSTKQKEDFVANFAHELKTPLTSIIGYADRIYQKELPREEQKLAAFHIWNEGMRLEALSLKLMDLTVMNHKDFVLQEMRADTVLHELVKDEECLVTAENVSLTCDAEAAYIKVEYDLLKTLFINLIDNSIKAGADCIQVKGYVDSAKDGMFYVIQIEDNGCGIPENEISRITEAFYMVDKSRSRKQHGAGIGLCLAEKIAQIHGSSLVFESDGKTGTKVSLRLSCKGGEADE